MRQKDQVMMFSDTEISLIKAVFADNDDLIYAIRGVLLQFELSKEEKKSVKDSMTPEVWAVVKKRIHPEVSNEVPLTQVGDIYQTLTVQLNSNGVDDMYPLFLAKILESTYLTQRLEVLRGNEVEDELMIDDWKNLDGKTALNMYIQTTARNFILGYVDSMLMHLKNMAGQKTETLEQAKKRLERNSTK